MCTVIIMMSHYDNNMLLTCMFSARRFLFAVLVSGFIEIMPINSTSSVCIMSQIVLYMFAKPNTYASVLWSTDSRNKSTAMSLILCWTATWPVQKRHHSQFSALTSLNSDFQSWFYPLLSLERCSSRGTLLLPIRLVFLPSVIEEASVTFTRKD